MSLEIINLTTNKVGAAFEIVNSNFSSLSATTIQYATFSASTESRILSLQTFSGTTATALSTLTQFDNQFTGGTVGQILTKADSGFAWGEPVDYDTIMYRTAAASSGGTFNLTKDGLSGTSQYITFTGTNVYFIFDVTVNYVVTDPGLSGLTIGSGGSKKIVASGVKSGSTYTVNNYSVLYSQKTGDITNEIISVTSTTDGVFVQFRAPDESDTTTFKTRAKISINELEF